MKILHICPHMGGGIGTVLQGWLGKTDYNAVICLDYANQKMKDFCDKNYIILFDNAILNRTLIARNIELSDIVVVHFWDHPMLAELFSKPLHESRMIFWNHKNHLVSPNVLGFPDLFIDVSPIQGHGRYIWSCGDMERFLSLERKKHEGFVVGYVGTIDFKKMHPNIMEMCACINIPPQFRVSPNAKFMFVGESNFKPTPNCIFTGKVDDVAPYLAVMDVFGYPLRENHYGTCEQVIGEAMCAGIVPVCMANEAESTIIDHGYNGFLAKDEREYIGYIEYLYDHPIQRKTMGENAREDGKKIYSIDRMVSEWESLFNDIMKTPKRQRGVL